jgi:LPXTG-motif cell wall-anchored protein
MEVIIYISIVGILALGGLFYIARNSKKHQPHH